MAQWHDPGLRELVVRTCDQMGLLRSDHDQVQQLVVTRERDWPPCCKGACVPCVEEHARVARRILESLDEP